MEKKPKILVVGSFVMDQIATTEVVPREGQTVMGKAPVGVAKLAKQYGKPVIAIGGSGRGADTVCRLTPEYTADLLGTRIHEILCKPR